MGEPLLVSAVLVAAVVAGPIQQAAVIPVEHRAFAACVSERESHGNYRAVNRDEQGRKQPSSARGRWQFIQSDWGHGLPFMVADRLVQFGMPRRDARQIRKQMAAKPIDKWTPVLQDIGFVAVVTHDGGWRHWALKNSRCNSLAVTR